MQEVQRNVSAIKNIIITSPPDFDADDELDQLLSKTNEDGDVTSHNMVTPHSLL